MAATGFELIGRSGDNNGVNRIYRVDDAADEQDIADYVASLPGTMAGFPFSTFSYDEPDEDDPDEGCYILTVTWGAPDGGNTGGTQEVATTEYRFSFQAPSAHIYQSLGTILYCSEAGCDTDPAEYGVPDAQGAINVVSEGGSKMRVEGHNLQAPPETFSLSYSDADAVIDGAYQNLVASLCGCVNSATFRGYAAGEIMLVRVNGSRDASGKWQIEFGFGYEPNDTNIPIGPNIEITAKDGFDLFWPFYENAKDADSDPPQLIKRPKYVYVERVWRRADLDLLNLPA